MFKKNVYSGVLFLKNKKILMCKESNFDHWDIPKGKFIIDGDYKNACIVGCEKQTGFNIQENDLDPINVFFYNKNKDIALYIYTGNNYPDPNKLFCSEISEVVLNKKIITNKTFIDFKYINFSDIEKKCTKPLYYLLKKIIFEYYNINI